MDAFFKVLGGRSIALYMTCSEWEFLQCFDSWLICTYRYGLKWSGVIFNRSH